MEEELGSVYDEKPKITWKELFLKLIETLKDHKGPVLTIKMPFFGCMTAAFLSHFVGNGIGWNILHFFCSWFYVSYKTIEYLTTHFN